MNTIYNINNITTKIFFELNNKTAAIDIDKIEAFTGLRPAAYTGCYKGIESPSYGLEVMNDNDINEVISLARLYSQESVLIVDTMNNARLLFCDNNKTIDLGKFQAVDNIEGLDAYTTIDGRHYGCL